MMTDTSTETVDRLTAVDQLRLHVDHELSEPDPSDLMDEVDALAAERDALKAEVERLRDTLIPFAEAADEADDCGFDEFNQAPVDCGQCREARAALQEKSDG